MYMDDIKLFAKNEIELETLKQAVRINNDDIETEFNIEKKGHANNEKRKTTNYERNRTTKSRKKQYSRRIGNLQILRNISRWHHQTSGDEIFLKEYLKRTRKLLETQLYHRNLIKQMDFTPCEIIETILEGDEERTSTDRPEKKNTHNDA